MMLMDKRMTCPKCHRRVNKFKAIRVEAFKWCGDRQRGQYESPVALYKEVHHCGGVISEEVLQ